MNNVHEGLDEGDKSQQAWLFQMGGYFGHSGNSALMDTKVAPLTCGFEGDETETLW